MRNYNRVAWGIGFVLAARAGLAIVMFATLPLLPNFCDSDSSDTSDCPGGRNESMFSWLGIIGMLISFYPGLSVLIVGIGVALICRKKKLPYAERGVYLTTAALVLVEWLIPEGDVARWLYWHTPTLK